MQDEDTLVIMAQASPEQARGLANFLNRPIKLDSDLCEVCSLIFEISRNEFLEKRAVITSMVNLLGFGKKHVLDESSSFLETGTYEFRLTNTSTDSTQGVFPNMLIKYIDFRPVVFCLTTNIELAEIYFQCMPEFMKDPGKYWNNTENATMTQIA